MRHFGVRPLHVISSALRTCGVQRASQLFESLYNVASFIWPPRSHMVSFTLCVRLCESGPPYLTSSGQPKCGGKTELHPNLRKMDEIDFVKIVSTCSMLSLLNQMLSEAFSAPR